MKTFVVFLALGLFGCAAAAQTTYEGELTRCVDQARSREESRACRARVDQAWGVDGGNNGTDAK